MALTEEEFDEQLARLRSMAREIVEGLDGVIRRLDRPVQEYVPVVRYATIVPPRRRPWWW